MKARKKRKKRFCHLTLYAIQNARKLKNSITLPLKQFYNNFNYCKSKLLYLKYHK